VNTISYEIECIDTKYVHASSSTDHVEWIHNDLVSSVRLLRCAMSIYWIDRSRYSNDVFNVHLSKDKHCRSRTTRFQWIRCSSICVFYSNWTEIELNIQVTRTRVTINMTRQRLLTTSDMFDDVNKTHRFIIEKTQIDVELSKRLDRSICMCCHRDIHRTWSRLVHTHK
jgi:hypothetical protein